jgi:hypothetical protein
MPVNFQNGKIYAIRSYQTDKVYIGSTTQTLAQRFAKHKNSMNCTSRQILVFDDCYIELLEEFPCANKMLLTKREGELIRSMSCINKQIAGRTRVEYYQDNKQAINEKNNQYYQDNKEHITEQRKPYDIQYRIDNVEKINEKYNCFCGGKYTNSNKNRHFKTDNHLECIRQLSA